MTATDELRQRMRAARAALEPAELERAASALAARLLELDEYRKADHIAAYFAVNGEISLDPVIDAALDAGKRIYLPNLDRQALRFAPYSRSQKMRINRFRLPEPDVSDDEMLDPADLDLVFAPLVVFDAECNRIGMGGGFYDRSFAFRKLESNPTPRLIGVAHELQRVERLVPEDWDVRLDRVVTDAAIYP